MKLIFIFSIFIYLSSCSFDNKSGIWINQNQNLKKSDNYPEFETLITANTSYYEIIDIKKDFKFNKIEKSRNVNWSDIFYDKSNNFINFKYENKNKLLLNSKKIAKNKISEYFLFNKVINFKILRKFNSVFLKR